MAATVSGAVLSSLFFSQSNCLGDQEGLLFGQVIRQVRDTISDSQISNYEVETKVYIYSCRDCTGLNSFHDKRCHIKENFFEDLKAKKTEVVGWYHFRRNTSPRISMKETCLHKNLLKSLPRENSENFLFFQCTVSPSGNMATHNFDYNLYKWSEMSSRFFKVPVNVVNLGDTTHTSYRLERSCTVSPECGAFRTVIAKYQSDLLDTSGRSKEIQNISALTHSLHSRLQELTQLVAESEQVLHTVEEDVNKSKKLLTSKLEEKKQNQPLPPSPTPPGHSEVSHGEINQKSKVSSEEAISIAKSKREQRRREGTKPMYPNLSTCLLTGRSASGKARSDSAAHHSRRLSGDTEYMDTVDISGLDSLPESDKPAIINENPTTSADDSCDLMDLTDNTDQTFAENDNTSSDSNAAEIEKHFDSSHKMTVPHSKSKEKETDCNAKSDPFSFVSDILKGANSKNQKHGKGDTMSVPTGGCIKMPVESALINDDQEETPQRKTRSQRSQKQPQSQNTRGQRSQVRQMQRSSKNDTVRDDNDSDSDGIKNSDIKKSGKLCRQQVTVDGIQTHLSNNTNSMHSPEEFIGDVEMTNVTDNDFEISSSPVF